MKTEFSLEDTSEVNDIDDDDDHRPCAGTAPEVDGVLDELFGVDTAGARGGVGGATLSISTLGVRLVSSSVSESESDTNLFVFLK